MGNLALNGASRMDLRGVSLLVLLGLAVSGCASGRDENEDTLTVGAYSVVREAFHEAILPAFARSWKAKTGRTVRFEESYNGSGAQSRAIAAGFDADVAILSLEGDIARLVKAGMVAKSWNQGTHKGMITRSLVVIGVRPGNPRSIHDWNDLAKPDVTVLYPDPKTSGGARWNINAIWGAGILSGDETLLRRVQSRVVNMDSSGRQSMATFERGTGDAIVTYENEVLLQGKLTGEEREFVVPPSTLLIEGPAAVVDASVNRHKNRALAEAFIEFLRGEESQNLLVAYGFRPLDAKLDTRPLPPRVFDMARLGGWKAVNEKLYDSGGVWDALFTDKDATVTASVLKSKGR